MEIKARLGDTIEIEGYPRKITVKPVIDGISIGVAGYGECNSDDGKSYPVFIDMFGVDGFNYEKEEPLLQHKHPRVVVFANINLDGCTHLISLEGAQVERSKKIDKKRVFKTKSR